MIHLTCMVDETNVYDRDSDKEESEPIAFTAKIIREGLESERKILITA